MDLEPIRKRRVSEYAIDELRKFISNNNFEKGRGRNPWSLCVRFPEGL